MDNAIDMDAVVFGGGVAGLFALDELVRAGQHCILLESHELGAGQTVASQGIIHGGMKYTLSGMFSAAARAVADMPDVWRACLAGERQPDLSNTRLRSHFCYLWQTASLKSRLGMFGARAGLRVKPRTLAEFERPDILRDAVGVVSRLDEQVIEPWSLITVLSELHRGRVFRIDVGSGLEFQRSQVSGQKSAEAPHASIIVRLINPDTGAPLDVRTRYVILAAGAGNAALREMMQLPPGLMQRRPLHMVMLRGPNLPAFNGHCVDGAATRVTITATRDFRDRPIWQIGGQIAERGVALDEHALIALARDELKAVLPQLNLAGTQWATYRVDRAEAAAGGARPNDVTIHRDGNVITAWPTKLALAPRLAALVHDIVVGASSSPTAAPASAASPATVPSALCDWPRPVVALPPWETAHSWITLD